jgi:hypothetical protein
MRTLFPILISQFLHFISQPGTCRKNVTQFYHSAQTSPSGLI